MSSLFCLILDLENIRLVSLNTKVWRCPKNTLDLSTYLIVYNSFYYIGLKVIVGFNLNFFEMVDNIQLNNFIINLLINLIIVSKYINNIFDEIKVFQKVVLNL